MQSYESPFFRIQQLADGVFAALAKPGAGGWANAGIVDLGRSSLVIDAMFTPAAGAALREAAEQLTGRPVRWLALTHRDHDHVLGAQAFSGAAVIATRQTALSMHTRIPGFLAAARSEGAQWLAELDAEAQAQDDAHERMLRLAVRGEYQALLDNIGHIVPRYPTLSFGEHLELHGRQRAVQILSGGGLHTESDTAVYLPEEHILFSGDLVQVGRHPAVRSGRPKHWPQVMATIANLEADVVVGGHGPVGTREDVLLAERYYFELPEWAAGAPVPEPFASWDAQQTFVENLRFAHAATSRHGPALHS